MEYEKKEEAKGEDKESEQTKVLSAINYLISVPRPVLESMMQFFGPQDLININQVSKLFFALSNNEKLWKKFGYDNKENYIKSIEEFLKKITALKEQDKKIAIALISLDNEPMKKMKTNFFHSFASKGEIAGVQRVEHEVGNFKFSIEDTSSSARYASITNIVIAQSNILLVFVNDNAELNTARQNFESQARSKGKGLPLIFYVVDKNSDINFVATPTSQVISAEVKNGKIVNPKEVIEDLQTRIQAMQYIATSMEEKRTEQKGFFK